MDNIVSVKLDSRYASTLGVWQYDYGRVLRITGPELPPAVEVQFSLDEKSGETLSRVGTTVDGVTEVKIPDELLTHSATSNYRIYAYIYLTDETSGSTEYEIIIPVRVRSKPTSPAEDPETDPDLFRETVVAVNASAERAENAASSAMESAASADETLAEIKRVADGISGNIENANTMKTELSDMINNAGIEKKELESSIGKAGEAKMALDSSIRSAGEKQLALDATVEHANTVDASLKEHIGSAEQIQANIEQITTNKEDIGSLKEDIGDSLGYKYYNIKILWTNGWFYNRYGSLASDSQASYTEIEVQAGEKYHIVGYNAYHLSLYSLRDSNKGEIKTYPDSSDTNYEKRKFDEYITMPEGVKYLYVSKWDSFGEMLVEKWSYTRVTDIDTATTEKITEFYQIESDTMKVGWANTNKRVNDDGEASTARHLTINNIIGGDTYRYTAQGGGNCHAVLWLDNIDGLISYVPFSKAWTQETVEVIAPANAVKAIVNTISTSQGELVFEHYGLVRIAKVNPIIEKRVTDIEKRVAELEDGTIDSFEYENIKKRVIENQIKNDFAWGEFDGLYATITFDDTNADIDQLQDLAEELSVPFCYATIPSKLENITSQGTETAKQVLERAVVNGGEVLSHWGPQLNSLSKDEDYYNVYAGAKKTLTENGFEVNGIITAGGGAEGTPESFKTQNFLKDIELARIYYKYADLTANSFVSGQDLRYIEQFFNERTFTDGGVAEMKSKIDVMALSEKGWLNLASHGTNNANTPTIDSFRQIFQYAIDKGFTFVTWNTMYEKFKSSKLEKRVKALELN